MSVSETNDVQNKHCNEEIPALNSLYINPTKYCNLACRHCWLAPPVKEELIGGGDEMSMFQIMDIIRSAREIGLNTVKFTGGEPLLRKDIEEVLEFCFHECIHTHIETNGTLVTKDIAAMLDRWMVDSVSVSLDSFSEEIHDRLRGRKGAFKKSIEGIKNLVAEECSPQVIISLYKENLKGFDRFLALMKDLGIDDIKINIISYIGRGLALKGTHLIPTVKEILTFYKDLNEISRDFDGSIYMDIPMAFKNIEKIKHGKCAFCAIKGMLGILADGAVSICGIGYQSEGLVFGNVKNDPSLLKEIWMNNPIVKQIRENIPSGLEGVCAECVFKKRCLGSCRAEVYYNTGDLFAPHWFCQEAFDKGVFPATRFIPAELKV